MNLSKASWILFLALTLVYFSMSPGTIRSMGYTQDNLVASGQMISNLGDWLSLRHGSVPVQWPRHGLFELLFQIPFLLLARLFFGSSPDWADRILSLEPVLVTALLCTLLFTWARRLAGSLLWGYVIALAAAFATMLWPYAYIGLETTQSLFLLAAGYLALGSEGPPSLRRTILFAVSCGLAVSLKSNGLCLIPVVAFLVFAFFRRQAQGGGPSLRKGIARPVTVVLVIAALYGLNLYTRGLSAAWAQGLFKPDLRFVVRDPVLGLLNLISLTVSINKGLLVYSPVLLLPLLLLPRAYRADRRVVLFAGLTLAGLMGTSSLLGYWSDETWGPRYLHSAVAPLLLCLAASRRNVRFAFRRELPFIALAVCGVFVSFLGIVFYYGNLHAAAIFTSQNRLETLQYDPNWNPIRFNLKLLRAWTRGDGQATPWPPPPHWWYDKPADAPPAKTIDLEVMATPQPWVLRSWRDSSRSAERFLCLMSLAAGLLLFFLAGRSAVRGDAAAGRR